MDREIEMQYFDTLTRLEGKEYITSFIAFRAAPTVKRLKPSSLMTFSKRNKNHLYLWDKYKNEICKELKVEYFELKEKLESKTVLFYNRKMLKRFLANIDSQMFIKKFGYEDSMTIEEKLQLLKKRFEKSCPHEIGIFLGYPVEDVKGFIMHRGKQCLMCRYWKVYENPERAQNLFSIYDTARISIARSVINYGGKALTNYL